MNHELEIILNFYRCPNCGTEHNRPAGEIKIRPIRKCRNCRKVVKMIIKKEQTHE